MVDLTDEIKDKIYEAAKVKYDAVSHGGRSPALLTILILEEAYTIGYIVGTRETLETVQH